MIEPPQTGNEVHAAGQLDLVAFIAVAPDITLEIGA